MDLVSEHQVKTENQQRISDYLIGVFHQLPSKSSIKKAIKAGQLFINQQVASTANIPTAGDIIQLYEEDQRTKPYPLQLEVVFEDEHLLIVNKPPGLPTSGNLYRTLANSLVYSHPQDGQEGRLYAPQPAHRLDSLTSGLVIAAKTREMLFKIGQLFENGKIQKTYSALVMGSTNTSGVIQDAIDQRPAITKYERLREVRSLKNGFLTLLKLSPHTGRTHQLRIHCAHSGFPIYGDPIYADTTIKNKGLFLAATNLKFRHPIFKTNVEVSIQLPSKFDNRMNNEQRRWERSYGNN